MKIGLFANGMKMAEYDYEDYSIALDDVLHVYEETGIPHEIKIINSQFESKN